MRVMRIDEQFSFNKFLKPSACRRAIQLRCHETAIYPSAKEQSTTRDERRGSDHTLKRNRHESSVTYWPTVHNYRGCWAVFRHTRSDSNQNKGEVKTRLQNVSRRGNDLLSAQGLRGLGNTWLKLRSSCYLLHVIAQTSLHQVARRSTRCMGFRTDNPDAS